jgi:DNA-binding transcriptional LysR family regulator
MIARWSQASPALQGLQDAARHLGIRHAALLDQIRQLETTTRLRLLRIGQGGTITLTADGEQFARDVIPVLTVLALAGTRPSALPKARGRVRQRPPGQTRVKPFVVSSAPLCATAN